MTYLSKDNCELVLKNLNILTHEYNNLLLLIPVTFSDPRKSGEWIKFNVKQSGFYRVNYTPDMWKQLADTLIADHNVIRMKLRNIHNNLN